MSTRHTTNTRFRDGEANVQIVNKRLRSSDPDLKITIGAGSDKKVFWGHSQILAMQSKYVDTMLATPMRESENYAISFPDVTPQNWEHMMEYLSPAKSPHLSIKLAKGLIVLYDKYEFQDGIDLCDNVLSKIFSSDTTSTDEKVEILVQAMGCNLAQTKEYGAEWIICTIDTTVGVATDTSCQDKMDLTVEQVRQLAPLMAENDRLSKKLAEVISIESRDHINSPLFPAHFVSQFELMDARKTARKVVNRIKVTCCHAAGTYYPEYDSSGSIKSYDLDMGGWAYVIKKEKGQNWEMWEMGGDTIEPDEMCYTCPNSRFAALPPETGWKLREAEDTSPMKLSYGHSESSPAGHGFHLDNHY